MATQHAFCINPCFSQLWNVNAILTAKIKSRYQACCTTNLTLKTVMSGSARYATPRSIHTVEPGSYLVLNQHQFYELDILKSTNTETLAIFFEPRFVEQAIAARSTDAMRLLDDPDESPGQTAPFVEALQTFQGGIARSIRRIARQLKADPTGESWLEDEFYAIGASLPSAHQQAREQWQRIPSVRNSTQKELYRRLAHARDYAYSCFQEELTVQRLASIAKLSPFHFHRGFRQAFGVTPNHFLRERRLQVACKLLKETDMPVTHICLAVGFSSLGSFSALFRNHFGVSPSSWRTQQD